LRINSSEKQTIKNESASLPSWPTRHLPRRKAAPPRRLWREEELQLIRLEAIADSLIRKTRSKSAAANRFDVYTLQAGPLRSKAAKPKKGRNLFTRSDFFI
jgi:hypothetical protein